MAQDVVKADRDGIKIQGNGGKRGGKVEGGVGRDKSVYGGMGQKAIAKGRKMQAETDNGGKDMVVKPGGVGLFQQRGQIVYMGSFCVRGKLVLNASPVMSHLGLVLCPGHYLWKVFCAFLELLQVVFKGCHNCTIVQPAETAGSATFATSNKSLSEPGIEKGSQTDSAHNKHSRCFYLHSLLSHYDTTPSCCSPVAPLILSYTIQHFPHILQHTLP